MTSAGSTFCIFPSPRKIRIRQPYASRCIMGALACCGDVACQLRVAVPDPRSRGGNGNKQSFPGFRPPGQEQQRKDAGSDQLERSRQLNSEGLEVLLAIPSSASNRLCLSLDALNLRLCWHLRSLRCLMNQGRCRPTGGARLLTCSPVCSVDTPKPAPDCGTGANPAGHRACQARRLLLAGFLVLPSPAFSWAMMNCQNVNMIGRASPGSS